MHKKILYGVLSVCLTMLLLLLYKTSVVDTLASCINYPMLHISSSIAQPIKRMISKNLSYEELAHTYETLKQEYQELKQAHIVLQSTLHYANKSKDLIAFKERYKLQNALLATVLVKTLTDARQTITINRGSYHGVKKNMVAIYKFQLIGRVFHVTPFYSKVMLITDKKSKVSAYTNATEAKGIVEGTNKAHKCHLRYVSHLQHIKPNDFILSSGDGLVFPEGFCLGKIISAEKDGTCHHVELEPLVDLKNLQMCLLTNLEKMNLF